MCRFDAFGQAASSLISVVGCLWQELTGALTDNVSVPDPYNTSGAAAAGGSSSEPASVIVRLAVDAAGSVAVLITVIKPDSSIVKTEPAITDAQLLLEVGADSSNPPSTSSMPPAATPQPQLTATALHNNNSGSTSTLQGLTSRETLGGPEGSEADEMELDENGGEGRRSTRSSRRAGATEFFMLDRDNLPVITKKVMRLHLTLCQGRSPVGCL